MTLRWLTRALGLCLFLVAGTASAQRVVVLELEGDEGFALRRQIETALKKAKVVEVVPFVSYKALANRKKLKGAKAMGPAGVRRLGRLLKIDAAVTGSVADQFDVRILDGRGEELWQKDLPVKGGRISATHARKLANAIAAAAANSKPAPGGEGLEEDPPEEGIEGPEEPRRDPLAGAAVPNGAGATSTGTPVSGTGAPGADARQPRLDVPVSDSRASTASSRASTRNREPDDPSAEVEQKVSDSDRRDSSKIGPRLVRLSAVGTTTWRAYCSRPGVRTCREYDALAEPRPSGVSVDFSPKVPYAGFALGLELFPLASMSRPLNGLGLNVNYGRGFSLTNVLVKSPQGETPERQVMSTDEAYATSAVYRFYFGIGSDKEPLLGFVGLRGGLQSRMFVVDPNAPAPLPGSRRGKPFLGHPAVGADLSIPLAKLVRLEASGTYLINPKVVPDDAADYGDPADPTGGTKAKGFAFEAGLTGDIWGPLGYSLRFRMASYTDTFIGKGLKWPCDDTQCGGAAEETYTGLNWGLTGAF